MNRFDRLQCIYRNTSVRLFFVCGPACKDDMINCFATFLNFNATSNNINIKNINCEKKILFENVKLCITIYTH